MREHHPQGGGVDRAGETHAHTGAFDLKRSDRRSRRRACRCTRWQLGRRLGPPRRTRRRGLLYTKRNENLTELRRLTHRRPSPGLQQPAADTALTGQIGNINPRLQALGNQRRLLRGSPPAAPDTTGDQLDPAIRVGFVPVLMHGIMVGSFHRLTRAAQCSRSFAKSSPRCEGEALASVTMKRVGNHSFERQKPGTMAPARMMVPVTGQLP